MMRLAAVVLAACNVGGGDSMQGMADAAVDMNTNQVLPVTCPSGTVPTVTTDDNSSSFMPMSTPISVNGIVKFVTSLEHNVVPNTITNTDPGLTVGFNTTKCLQFTVAGTFGFACGPHGFVGTVVVN